MLKFFQILVCSLTLAVSAVALSGCGQQGPLYLPTQPGAANRATLPQTLWPKPHASAPQTPSDDTSATPSQPQPNQ